MDLPIQCACAKVGGVARQVSPTTVNHCVCYCTDCRAFLHWLGQEALLDPAGGAWLVQTARNAVEIHAGWEHVRGVRLSAKGMFRWYAACCRAPLANTVAGLPFAGVATAAFGVPQAEHAGLFGPVFPSSVQTALASPKPTAAPWRRLLHAVLLFGRWTLTRQGHPSPFFDRAGQPLAPVQVLTLDERQLLRAHPRA